MLSQDIANSWYSLSAYDGNKLVGFGRVVTDGILYAMIYDLVFAPTGYGTTTPLSEDEYNYMWLVKGSAQFLALLGFYC